MHCTIYSTQGCTEATVKLYRPWLSVLPCPVPRSHANGWTVSLGYTMCLLVVDGHEEKCCAEVYVHYLFGPTAPFPSQPSPVSTPKDTFPLVPLLTRLLRCRSLQSILTAMRIEGSLPLGGDPPSYASIDSFCRHRDVDNCRPNLPFFLNKKSII